MNHRHLNELKGFIYGKNKFQIFIALNVIIILVNAFGSADPASTSKFSTVVDSTIQNLPKTFQEKVPIPPTTSTVKCKCETVEPVLSPTVSNLKEANSSKAHKDIEIQIFNSESDVQTSNDKSSIDRSGMVEPSNDSPEIHQELPISEFKSFRNIELFGTEIHSSNPLLVLGLTSSRQPFEGPRRRRKRSTQPQTADKNKNVVYVYPINYNPSFTSDLNTKQFSERNFNLVNNPQEEVIKIPKEAVQNQLKIAMADAWQNYGPKSPPIYNYNKLSIRSQTDGIPNNVNSFQKHVMGASDWNGRVTELPVSVIEREDPQPGFFSRILSNYIDFEVNNQEVADFMRKLLFGIIIGTLIAGWIFLGIALEILPIKWMLFNEKQRSTSSADKLIRNALDDEDHAALSHLTDRVMLALDTDWLTKLEDIVRNDPNGSFTRTQARCCIFPDAQTDGRVHCQLVRKDKAQVASTFKCSTGLIYNFQFGGEGENESGTDNSTSPAPN